MSVFVLFVNLVVKNLILTVPSCLFFNGVCGSDTSVRVFLSVINY